MCCGDGIDDGNGRDENQSLGKGLWFDGDMIMMSDRL